MEGYRCSFLIFSDVLIGPSVQGAEMGEALSPIICCYHMTARKTRARCEICNLYEKEAKYACPSSGCLVELEQ
jgi:hypothetical protein